MMFRAKEEAAMINSTKHELLDNVGGSVSLEMQLPKLLWLRRYWKKKRFNQKSIKKFNFGAGQLQKFL